MWTSYADDTDCTRPDVGRDAVLIQITDIGSAYRRAAALPSVPVGMVVTRAP